MAVARWTAVEENLKQNLSDPNDPAATSVARGIVGTDIGATFDLGGGRIGMVLGDSVYAPTGGLSRSAALVASGGFVRNAMIVLTGTNLETATVDSYVRTSPITGLPAPYFPTYFHTDQFYTGAPGAHGPKAPKNPSSAIRPVSGTRGPVKYPLSGIKLSLQGEDRVLVMGMFHVTNPHADFGSSTIRPWAMLAKNISGTPDTWSWKEIPVPGAGDANSGETHFVGNGLVEYGPHVYTYANGPNGAGNQGAFCRYLTSNAFHGTLDRPEWLTASGWSRDYPYGPNISRLNILPAAVVSDQAGAIHRRPDGQWQLTAIPQTMLSADPRVGRALRANPDGAFGALTELYDIPMSANDFCYQALFALFTWAGQGANDYCVLYSQNRHTVLDNFNNATSYQLEVLQVTE